MELKDESDLLKWRGTIKGPVGTPYEGGKFSIDIELPADYPFVPPKVDVSNAREGREGRWRATCVANGAPGRVLPAQCDGRWHVITCASRTRP